MLKLPATSPTVRRPALKSPMSPDRRVSKKYRKAHIRKLREKEFRRLRSVVPALAHKEKVTKVAVIEEAILYIDELHRTLMERIHGEQPEKFGLCTKADVVIGSHNLFAQMQKLPFMPLVNLPYQKPTAVTPRMPHTATAYVQTSTSTPSKTSSATSTASS